MNLKINRIASTKSTHSKTKIAFLAQFFFIDSFAFSKCFFLLIHLHELFLYCSQFYLKLFLVPLQELEDL